MRAPALSLAAARRRVAAWALQALRAIVSHDSIREVHVGPPIFVVPALLAVARPGLEVARPVLYCNGAFACSGARIYANKSDEIARLLCEKTTLPIYFSLLH